MAGGSSGGSSGGKKKARIEIIPLIDVVFFLLATFVLFTLSLNKTSGVNVTLPGSETGENRDPTGAVTISMTSEGLIAWDKDTVNPAEFLTRLQGYKQSVAEPKVLINADENSTYQQVRYILDESRKAGIQKVLIETKLKQAGQ